MNSAIIEKANIESQEILKQIQRLRIKHFIKNSQEYELRNNKFPKSFIGKNCTSKLLVQYKSKVIELAKKIEYFHNSVKFEKLIKVITNLKDCSKIDLYKSNDINEIKKNLDIASETFHGPSDWCLNLIEENNHKEEIKIFTELLYQKEVFDKFHFVFHMRRKILSEIFDIQSNIEQQNQKIFVNLKMANFFRKVYNSSDILTLAENEIISSNIFSHRYTNLVKDAENNIIRNTTQIYKIREVLTITIPLKIQEKKDLLLTDPSMQQIIKDSIKQLEYQDWRKFQEKLSLEKSIQSNKKIVSEYNNQLQIYKIKSDFFSDYLQSEPIEKVEISRSILKSEYMAFQRVNKSRHKIFQLKAQKLAAKEKLNLIQYT